MENKQKIVIVILVALVALGVAWKFVKSREALAPAPVEATAPSAEAPQPQAKQEPKAYQGVSQPVLKVDAAEKQRILRAQSIFAPPPGAGGKGSKN